MKLLLTPNDTLFSKNGKPFGWGEESFAEGIFPPPPGVMYGALRTAYFSENISDFPKAETPEDPTRDLSMKNVILFNDTPLFPAPMDLLLCDEKYLKPGLLSRNSHFSSSSFSHMITSETDDAESAEGIYISQTALKFYAGGSERIDSFYRIEDIMTHEPKVGIKRDNSTGTVDEGMLYRVSMIRMKPGFRFIVEFEGITISAGSVIRLGGEGKTVSAELTQAQIVRHPFNKSESGIYKLYLQSPAVFENGSLPRIFSENNGKFEILTAVTGKTFRTGGFDMLKKKPKPMYKIVPAGSVIYFRAEDTDAESLLELDSISDYGMGKYGYGNFQIFPYKGGVK